MKDGLDDSSLLSTLIDSLPEHVLVKDAESRYGVNNVAHIKALGAASPEEVAGKRGSDFYPKELAKRYRAGDQEVISSGQPLVDREEPSVDEEGKERWHSTTKVPFETIAGRS
jgi:PAS domain-containing protein